MYDDNCYNKVNLFYHNSCHLEIDNDDSYVEEVDNTIWIESLIRDIDLD